MSSQAPSHPADEGRTRESVQSLLDFVVAYETDLAADQVQPLAEYQRRFPEIAELVAEEHALLARRTARGPSTVDGPKPRVAHYVLEREIGCGGQGHVYLATDLRMNRRVALKMLNHASLTPDKLQRFRREVEVIARLDHPGLCTVYEADLDAARPYLAMRFVDGEDLSRKLASARGGGEPAFVRPQESTSLARLLHVFERAARALHAAHEAGVVHRDVKPANILLGEDDEPVIVDFGLARGHDSELAGLTRTDDVLGTPAYMAPELLASGHSSADRRVDVYALGVALYECLTLERPFSAEHREALFHSILHGEYENPRILNPLVGEDLRVVVATALERQPARRYATALEFAEDLRRVREYEPIRARRTGWIVRLRRWSQRNPGIAAATTIVFFALSLSSGTLQCTLGRVEAQRLRAESERDRARAANSRLLGVECREESATLLPTNPGLALVLAIEADRRDPGFASNMAVLRALRLRHEERTYWATVSLGGDVDVSPDGRRVLLATARSQGLVFDLLSSLPEVESERVHQDETARHGLAAFSPDGASFFVSDRSPSVRLFDSTTGHLLRSFDGHSTPLTSCTFSPDGRRLLTCSLDGYVRLFDVGTGACVRTLASPGIASTLARFDPTGSRILTAKNSRPDVSSSGGDDDPRLWDAESGSLLAVLCGHTSPIRDARFSADGETAWTVEVEGLVRAWEPRSATERWTARLPGEGWCLASSPDGRRIAVGFDHGARVLEARNGAAVFDVSGLSGQSVQALAFSPDGRWLAAQDYGGAIGAWSLDDGARRMRSRAPGGQSSLCWHPDSKRFVTSSGDAYGHLWTVDPVPDLVAFGNPGAPPVPVRSTVFDATSRHVLSAGDDGFVRTWSARDGSSLHELDLGAGPLVRAWFVSDEGRVACLARSGAVALVDPVSNGRSVVRAADGGSVTTSALSSSGDSVCFGLDDGRLVWLETRTGRTIGTTDRRGQSVGTVAIAPSGLRVAWGATDGWAGLLERDGSEGCAFYTSLDGTYRPQVFTVAFVGAGNQMMTCGDHGGTKLWNVTTGKLDEVRGIRASGCVAHMHGGDLVLSAKWACQVFRTDPRLVDVRWRVVHPSTDASITALRLSPRNEHYLTASRGGVAQLSRTADGAPVLRYEHGTSPLTCAEFSPDGRAVVTAAEDGSVRVWPVDVVGVARAHVASTPELWPLDMPREVEGP